MAKKIFLFVCALFSFSNYAICDSSNPKIILDLLGSEDLSLIVAKMQDPNWLQMIPSFDTRTIDPSTLPNIRFKDWQSKVPSLIQNESLDKAGGFGAGNGGGGVVCRDKDGKVRYVQFFDMWEGNVGETNGLPAELIVEDVLQRLKILNPWFYEDFKKSVEDVYVKVNWFLAQGKRITLERIFDSKHLYIDEVCPNGDESLNVNYEQVVDYTDEGLLLVNKSLFSHLSETGKAALYLHEALYKLFRDAGDKDSVRARAVNAALLSNLDDESLAKILLEKLGDKYAPDALFQRLVIKAFSKDTDYWNLNQKELKDVQALADTRLSVYKQIYPQGKTMDQVRQLLIDTLAARFMNSINSGNFAEADERMLEIISYFGEPISLATLQDKKFILNNLLDTESVEAALMYRQIFHDGEDWYIKDLPAAEYKNNRTKAESRLPQLGNIIAKYFSSEELIDYADQYIGKNSIWSNSGYMHYDVASCNRKGDSYSLNFLMVAAEMGSIELVRKILQHHAIGDAYVRAEDRNEFKMLHNMALDYALQNTSVKNCEVIKELARYTDKLTVRQSFALAFSGCK